MYSLKVWFKDGVLKESLFDTLESVEVDMGILEVCVRQADGYSSSSTSYRFDLAQVLSWYISR